MNCVDDKLKEELLELSRYIYDNPELGYEEYKASAAHAGTFGKAWISGASAVIWVLKQAFAQNM